MNHELLPPWIIVPGWGGSGADHWQTRWADAAGAVRVELADWCDPKRDAWLAAIESAFTLQSRRDPRPPVIIAHSLGCIAVAEWARTKRRAVRAAFLVAPADVDRTECEPMFHDFQPLPRTPLPFRSLVVTSDNDPHVTLARAEDLAAMWGSELHVIHAGGHLNAASGLGSWLEGRALLADLVRQTSFTQVPRDERVEDDDPRNHESVREAEHTTR
jgi:predicted alpha/beta hydrolase family esterase